MYREGSVSDLLVKVPPMKTFIPNLARGVVNFVVDFIRG